LSKATDELLQPVWDEVAGELSRLAAAMGIASARAGDVLQDIYLTAWQKRPPGADAADLRRWLFRVAVNRCRLEHRRHGRWQRVLGGLKQLWTASSQHSADGSDNAADALGRQEERELVRGALERLEPASRTVLVLRYFTDLDSQEIGKILGLPDSTVRGHLRTARNQLAGELKRAGYQNE
jgi:RNA polymerase sigma-70 factor (ECF subfamily)